ncbi:hypothetical protein [Laedolimicola sp.]|uniref:hypothetical protein n=1 Tax=Laedolimicola sp. TaxID=2981663 RepID=UPI003F7D1583
MKRKKILLCILLTAALLADCNARNTDTDITTPSQGTEDTADSDTPLISENEKSGSVTPLAVNIPTGINGTEFTIITEQAYPDDDEFLAVSAVYGDQTLKLDESFGVNGIYEVVQADGIYVMTETYTLDDYGITYLVKIDENGITQTDTRDGSLGEMPADSKDGFPITSKIDVLGSYGGTRIYTIENGRFITDSTLYEFRGTPDGYRPVLTVTGEISCRIEGGSTELKPGDIITPTAYSEDGVFYFEREDGTPGSFQVDLDGEGNYAYTIGGVDENELFESLPYAG